MHSAEPIEPTFVKDPSGQVHADETWRAEMAARVNRYRDRRRRNAEAEDSPSLDFGPLTEAQDVAPPKLEGRNAPPVARNAFDTNYYRRLNAESMAQVPSMLIGASAAATARVPEMEIQAEASADAIEEKPQEDVVSDSALDIEIRPDIAGDAVLERYCITAPEPEPQPEPAPSRVEAVSPLAPQGNLIVFRRPVLEPPLLPVPSRDELAEPMNNRPRILEVPEDIMPAVQGSLFPEIRLDMDEPDASNYPEQDLQMPLIIASVSERLMASLIDLGLVATGGAIFAAMAYRALPEIPHGKPFWMALGAVAFLFWTVYQHLFLLYAGQTPGMSLRKIRLSTFDGRVPEWKQRSCRARFVFVSCASVALGFLWALIDEDELCWHDRISQTFPTSD